MKRTVTRSLVLLVAGMVLTAGAVEASGGSRATHETGLAAAERGRRSVAPRRDPDALTRALSAGRLDRPEYALERAISLFDLNASRARWGEVNRPDPHDATLLLRDLVLHQDELSGADRRRAGRVLARPSDGASDPERDGWTTNDRSRRCMTGLDGNPDADVCLNWVNETGDKAEGSFIDDSAAEMRTVWTREIDQLGYRAPQSDLNSDNHGANGALDIYFADIGDDGLYGYCTTDEPHAGDKKTVSAYCVLDNDYKPSQYDSPPPEVSGLDALRVTLAHEFFHAVQFNYDWTEKLFLMEGTAVWMEEQVYDPINAAYAFLFDSALHQPEVPLDAYQHNEDENFEYGAFVFFTRLGEVYGAGFPGTAPGVIRGVWRFAGGTKRGIGAVRATINRRDFPGPPERYPGPSSPFRDFFTEWGAANSLYDMYYEEGFDGDCAGTGAYADVLHCQRPPYDGQFLLGGSQSSTGWRTLPLDRRSNRFAELVPLSGNELELTVDLPDEDRGGEATLVRLENPGGPRIFRVPLNHSGNGSRSVPITSDTYDFQLVLTNTGASDNQKYKFKAEVQ